MRRIAAAVALAAIALGAAGCVMPMGPGAAKVAARRATT